MEQIGFVRKTVNEKMELEVRRGSGWGSGCKECSSSCEEVPHIVVIPNNLGAKVGDFVQLQAEVGNLLKYTFILYMIPFIFLIGGIVIGNYIFRDSTTDNREMLSFVSGLISVGISLIILKVMDKKAEKKDDGTITAVKIL